MAWVFVELNGLKGASHYRNLLGQASRKNLPDAYAPEMIPEVGELDELEPSLARKKQNLALDGSKSLQFGILGWVLGDHSAKTFEPLWAIVRPWQCYFYVTDGWSVYPGFIPAGDQIVSKTYMTRVESENTRLRHYLARLHPEDPLLFQVRADTEGTQSDCYFTISNSGMSLFLIDSYFHSATPLIVDDSC